MANKTNNKVSPKDSTLSLMELWNTTSSKDDGYREDEFYTRSSDNRGHSGTIYARIPPEVSSLVEQLIESKKFSGYRTKADFVRDAMIHRLHFLLKDSEEEIAKSELSGFLAVQELLQQEEMADEQVKTLKRLENVVDNLLAEGAQGKQHALKFLNTILTSINSMPEGFRKEKLTASINGKYGHILEGNKDGTVL